VSDATRYRQVGKAPPLDVLAERGEGDRPPPPAGSDPTPTPTLQLYLPEIFPIPGATEFDVFTHAASPGAGTLLPAALRFVLPPSSLGIVRVATAGVDDMTNATRIAFRLRLNGAFVPGPAGNLQLFAGVAARATLSVDCFVRVPGAGVLDVAIVNTDGAAYQVGAGFSGWFWGEAADRRWRGLLYGRTG